MKPRNYCCCAIPVVNAGVYATLAEQLVLGILVGTLSVATPAIVGAATPSFAKWIMAIICYVGAAIQILGFVGVAQERSIMFRRYLTLHIMVTVAAFSVAAVWIGLSAGRHNTAKNNCVQNFFTGGPDGNASILSTEGNAMCDIFPWVDVGLMGALWVLLAISQFYFYVVLSGYGTGQRIDHEKYDSVYSTSNILNNEDIPMTNRNDPWNSEPSSETLGPRPGYGHMRTESTTSDVAMLHDPTKYPGGEALSYPAGAYTQEPTPTPQYNAQQDPYYSNNSWPGQPGAAQAHPGQS